MYKEYMDAQTILFTSDSFCKAYHLKYFNEHYNTINSQLAEVKEIYYKRNSNANSWINYRSAILSSTDSNITDKISRAARIDVTTLPACTYIDANGYQYSIGAKDGLDSPSALKPKLTFKPENFELKLYNEMINGERKYRLYVNFKADITNAIIIFNGLYYPYRVNENRISVTYYEEDGVEFPKKIRKDSVIGSDGTFDDNDIYVKDYDGTIKVFDPDKNREYYSIIPYAWSGIKKKDPIYAKSIKDEYIEFPEEIDDSCLLFYNSMLCFFEVNNYNSHLIKIIDDYKSKETRLDKIKIVRFENTNKNQGRLKQQRMVGLFHTSENNATVYFPSSVSDGIITYNGINETFLINPDNRSLRFMLPHEIYGINSQWFTEMCEGSFIHCVNFYTGDIDGNSYTLPHDELTGIANKLINKYKSEAETVKSELIELQKQARLIYFNYKDNFSKYKKDFFEGVERPYFELKYKPIEHSIKLYINGINYELNRYFYYHLLDGKTPILVWNYLEMENGFDIQDDFEIYAIYDILYSENKQFVFEQ